MDTALQWFAFITTIYVLLQSLFLFRINITYDFTVCELVCFSWRGLSRLFLRLLFESQWINYTAITLQSFHKVLSTLRNVLQTAEAVRCVQGLSWGLNFAGLREIRLCQISYEPHVNTSKKGWAVDKVWPEGVRVLMGFELLQKKNWQYK